MAERFTFRLDVVERLRRKERDELRRAVAQKIAIVEAASATLHHADHELRDELEQMRNAQNVQDIDVAAMRTHRYYISQLHRSILTAQADLAARSDELKIEQEKLAQSSARLRAIERLREKRWLEHVQQLRRIDQIVSDGLSIAGFVRADEHHEQGVAM